MQRVPPLHAARKETYVAAGLGKGDMFRNLVHTAIGNMIAMDVLAV
jgi:hypothetical protein